MKKKLITKVIENKDNIIKAAAFGVGLVIIFPVVAYAAPTGGTEQFDEIIKWIGTWVTKVGAAIAFFGGVQTALAFKNDDADRKAAGVKTLVSGFMVAAIPSALSMFGF